MSLTVGSLFSGIGGIDLGLERAGMTVIWQSEIDPYCCRVLAKHWPDVPNLGDVTTIDWENDGLDHGDGISRSLHVDVICGGYPCQPFSVAGSRAANADPRHMWPVMLRTIDELRPRWVVIENVLGHLNLGFEQVLQDLADIGFDAEWTSLTACAFGAPHMRRRLLCVAYPRSERCEEHDRPSPVLPELVEPGGGGIWPTEPNVGRVAHGVPYRVDRVRALGNAVVPDVAEFIGRQILAATRTAVADGQPTRRGTPHTTARVPVGVGVPQRTSHTVASVDGPSVNRHNLGADQRGGDDSSLSFGVVGVGPVDAAGGRELGADGGAGDEPGGGADHVEGHTHIQPQTVPGVNHKLAARDQPPVADVPRQRVADRGRPGTPSPMATPAGTHL